VYILSPQSGQTSREKSFCDGNNHLICSVSTRGSHASDSTVLQSIKVFNYVLDSILLKQLIKVMCEQKPIILIVNTVCMCQGSLSSLSGLGVSHSCIHTQFFLQDVTQMKI